MACVVLAYHSHNIFGTEYGNNDHVALQSDLRTIAEHGGRIAPLREIAEMVAQKCVPAEELVVGLSFDDGAVFDVEDFVHPKFGPQRGFLNIMKDAQSATPGDKAMHATSFVIASPETRRALERADECGYTFLEHWLSDSWWRNAADSGYFEIGNHTWDHVHHVNGKTVLTMTDARDDFTLVRNYIDADREIRTASDWITARIGRPCEMFAYPFGHSNDFLSRDYLPGRSSEHRARAAFGTQGRAIGNDDSVWDIPRLICGHHWKTTSELQAFLRN